MKQTELIMGMPITVETERNDKKNLKKVFNYFRAVDEQFSLYKKNSEVSRFSRGEIKLSELSKELKLIIELCEQTKKQTNGYFNPYNKSNQFDPSGIVKGWAI